VNYSELTRRYFGSAMNAGELRGTHVFRGAAGSLAQGTWVQFDLQIAQGKIQAARFRAFACPHTIAVCAWLTEAAVGNAPQATLPESVQQIRDRFEVPVAKMGRLLVIEDAWTAAAAPAVAGVERA
jgi:NifU-like protein involved in Fe-S cluster formation